MSRRGRLALFAAAAIGVMVVLAVGDSRACPPSGTSTVIDGRMFAHVTVAQRKATDVVTAITFDYRGLDTMGEEFILFAASIGVVVLLREQRDERRESEADADANADAEAETGDDAKWLDRRAPARRCWRRDDF